MLAPLATILIVLGTLVILGCNVLMTGLFLRQPPRGEQAMGLVVVLFGFMIAGALIALASLLASLRSDRALAAVIHLPWWATGILTMVMSFGVALAAFMAFTMWAEPGMSTPPLRALKHVLCWMLGIFGPILLAWLMTVDAFSTPQAIQAQPKMATALRAATWALAITSALGYLGGAYAFGQPVRVAAANVLRSTLASVRGSSLKLPPGATLASELRKDLDRVPADEPIPTLLEFFIIDDVADDDECRAILIQRVLDTPDAGRLFAEVMRSNKLRSRWGGSILIHSAPDSTLQANSAPWAHAIQCALLATAQDMDSRPLFLSDNYELNPNPHEFVRVMLQAADRFRDTPHHAALDQAARTMAQNASHLKRDKRWSTLAKVMARAGYPIPERNDP
jgi:hypothetical protein